MGAILAALLMVQAGGAALAPSGKWTVERTDGECVMERAFGTGPDRVTLGYQQSLIKPGGALLLVTAGAAATGTGAGDIRVDPGGRAFPVRTSSATLDGGRLATRYFGVSDDLWAVLPGATTLELPTPGGARRLDVTTIRAALKAVKDCSDQLIRDWGADPAAVVPYTPDFAARHARLVTYDDYPTEAIRNGEQGRLVTLTSIGADGRPRECKVVKSSGSRLLDAHSCGLVMRRLRVPATTDGQVRWSVLPFVWTLPTS